MKKALKVRIDVKVSLSHETLLFLQSVLGGKIPEEHQPLKLVEKPVETAKTAEKPVETTKTAEKPVETTKTAEKPVETTKTAEKPVETTKTAETTTTGEKPNIESIRSLLGTKVNDFRKEIKDKLTEFGAKNVTTLDESKYVEFFKFLSSLK